MKGLKLMGAVLTATLLVAGSASAELVSLTFEGTVTEYWAEFEAYCCGCESEVIQDSYEEDVYDATIQVLFNVENYVEDSGTIFGIPWTAIFVDGSFVEMNATAASGSLNVTAADLAAYDNSWNYGAATYDTLGDYWLAAGAVDAGGVSEEHGQGWAYSEGANGLLAAGGDSNTGAILATASLVEWTSFIEGDDCCWYTYDTVHGYCFDGVLTGYECVVPEPASLTLLGIGLSGMAAFRLRRRKK